MSKKTWFSFFTAAALCLFLSGLVAAQEITGVINGSVKDKNGAAVSGANVTVMDRDKKVVVRTVTSNEEGNYSVPNLPSAVYQVTVEAPNFKKSVQTDIKLDVGARRSVDVELEAGAVNETVTIQADSVAVETTSPQVSTVINGDQIRELSINNRNFVSLVTLAPGVTNDLDDSVFTGTNNPDTQVVNRTLISVNGARPTQNTFTVDGADVTDRGSNLTIQAYPSVDSIGEFRVLRSLYPAESGQSGGGQVNVVTRSGGDKFHGSLFEFIRNDAFNANTVATNSLANPPFGRDDNGKAKRKPFRYNNYGWTVGGPVYFLKFGDHDPSDSMFGKLDRTYFFYSEEFRKDIRYPTLSGFAPTSAMENGVFPVNICLSGTIVGATRTCNSTLNAGTPIGNMVAVSNVARQYVNQIWSKVPDPTDPSTLSLVFPALNIAKFRQEIVKIDKTFSDKLNGFYRFENDRIPTSDADGTIGGRSGLPFVNTMDSNSPGKTHTAQFTYAPSSNLVFEGRYVYGFGAIYTTTTGLIAKNVSQINMPLPYASQRDVVPVLGIAGLSSLTGFSNYNNFSWKQGWGTSATWILGNHTTKYGVNYSIYRKNENALAGTNQGSVSAFNNTPATLPTGQSGGSVLATGVANTNINNAYQAFANFLQGNSVSFTQSKLDVTADFRQKALEWYAQDEWKFRRNLTLYYGVRYSFFGSPYDRNGQLTNFVPELYNRAFAPEVTGQANRVFTVPNPTPGQPPVRATNEFGNLPNACNGLIINTQNFQTGPSQFFCTPTPSPWGKHVYNVDRNNFAPRVGIAWDPFGNGKTALRSGWGIYYDQISASATELILGQNPPYQETCTITGTSLDQPVPGNVCTAQAAATVSSLRGIQPNFRTPYLASWSLDLQHQLGRNTILTVGYYGSKGTHLIGFTEYNNLAPGKAIQTTCAAGAGTLRNPTAGTQLCQTLGTAFTATPALLDQVRPFRGYRSINMLETRYNSNYHSLQLSAQHRFSGASQVNLAYTWSKNLTDNPTSYINAAPQDNGNIISERGLAPLDRRHVITVNGIYELPFFKKEHNLLSAVLGGWQLSGIVSYQTGSPYTITSSSYDPGGIGFIPSIVAGGRPNLTCDPNANAAHTVSSWFDTTCFAPQTATGIQNIAGTAGRGIIEGPPTRKVDMTLSKNFHFTESMSLQLRAEAFNVFNITNLRLGTTPNLSRIATTFGQITSFRDPRVLQFGAKFYF